MISISNFGNWTRGRLGNQIFQFSLLFSLHKSKGYEISLPLNNNCQFWNCFDINEIKIFDQPENDNLNVFIETNGSCNFDHIIFQQTDNTKFDGYFQSYRYFDEYKKELINCLNFKNNIIKEGNDRLSKYKSPLTSIHVRRGDYLSSPIWGNLIKEGYYEKAIEDIRDNEEVLVFSDDVNFVKDYFKNKKNFNIIDEDEYISLYMMTKCQRHIIANSSFSWMGAYLSGQENITCPHPWWPSCWGKPNNIQKDIAKPEWKKINVFN